MPKQVSTDPGKELTPAPTINELPKAPGLMTNPERAKALELLHRAEAARIERVEAPIFTYDGHLVSLKKNQGGETELMIVYPNSVTTLFYYPDGAFKRGSGSTTSSDSGAAATLVATERLLRETGDDVIREALKQLETRPE